MSDLIVIAYPDRQTAFTARDKLGELTKMNLVKLEDVVVVERADDGKPKIHQANNLGAAGALSGSFWGLLIGMIFWMPWLGLAVGALSGFLGGRAADIGVDDKFIKEVGEKIEPNTSALFMLVIESTPDRFMDAMKEFGGEVIQTSLSLDDEAKLRAAFGG
jgi:uncharacterized membrane protein